MSSGFNFLFAIIQHGTRSIKSPEQVIFLSILLSTSLYKHVLWFKLCIYGKYPNNSNTKASDKMTYANSVDPDQTAPEGAV